MVEVSDIQFLQTGFAKTLNKILRLLSFVLSLACVGIVAYFVMARYIFKVDFPGFEEITTIIIFWMYFIGGAYASYNQTHIKADIVNLIKSERVKKLIRIIALLISVIIGSYVLYLSYNFMMWHIEKNVVSNMLKLPMWIAHSALVVGYVFMIFYDIVHLCANIADYRKSGRMKIEPKSADSSQ